MNQEPWREVETQPRVINLSDHVQVFDELCRLLSRDYFMAKYKEFDSNLTMHLRELGYDDTDEILGYLPKPTQDKVQILLRAVMLTIQNRDILGSTDMPFQYLYMLLSQFVYEAASSLRIARIQGLHDVYRLTKQEGFNYDEFRVELVRTIVGKMVNQDFEMVLVQYYEQGVGSVGIGREMLLHELYKRFPTVQKIHVELDQTESLIRNYVQNVERMHELYSPSVFSPLNKPVPEELL